MFKHQYQALFVKPKIHLPALLIPRPSSLATTKNFNIPPKMTKILELGGILKQSHFVINSPKEEFMLLFLVLWFFKFIYLMLVQCVFYRNKLFQFSSHNEPVRYESLAWPQVAELQGRERSFHPGELQVNALYYKAVQPPSPAPMFFQTSLGRKMTDLSQ